MLPTVARKRNSVPIYFLCANLVPNAIGPVLFAPNRDSPLMPVANSTNFSVDLR
jgi:hypothetical protein